MKGSRSVLMAMAFALSLVVMSGCAKKAVETPVVEDKGAKGQAESLDTPASDILEGRTSGPMLPVYFDFDKSDIRADQVDRIENNAAFLKKNTVRIRVEGNCDERGTNEYNLALGERRAQSAKKYLVNLGVDDARLETVSWGEEKALLFGHDEISWAQNRRADFVIIK